MRKHFLLLFLMALLPLAGWAVDVTTAEFTIGSTTLEYVGKKTSPAITSATVGGNPITSSDYSLKFYKRTGETIGDEVANLINVGDYFVRLYDGEHVSNMKLAFSIVKVDMTISLKNVKKTYGAADPIATDFEYTVLDGFVGDDDKNSVVINVSVPAENARVAGEHVGFYNYSGITATSQNYNIRISAQPQLEIKPATLTVTHADIVKNFGEGNPDLNVSDFDITGWVGYEATSDPDYEAHRAAAITFNSASYTQTKTDANCNKDGVFIGGATAGYECKVTGIQLNSKDYTLSFAGVKMKIKQIELKDDADLFTFTKANADKTYDGTVQTPDYTIVYKANSVNYQLKSSDFEVTYAENSGVAMKAGNYTATVKAVAGGNFYATDFTKEAFDFTIAQRKLYVQAKNASKPYDAEPFTLTGKTKTDFEFNGIADTDAEYTLTANGSVAYVQTLSDAQKKNVGSYKVQPNITTFTLVDGSSNHWEANYKIEALSTATYAITQRPLTITAKNQEIDYGNPAPAFESSATYIHVEQIGGKKIDGTTNVAEGEGAVVTEVNDILAKLEVGLNGEYTAADAYEKAIVVALKDGEALPNYKPNYVAGDYTINGGTYTIIANNITKTYGEDYTLGYTTTGADPAATVGYEVYKAGVRVAGDHPTDAGVYDIKIAKNDAYKPSADYSTINYVDGKLTIKKKKLTIQPVEVSLNVGATVTELRAYGSVEFNGKLPDDQIKYQLAFNSSTTVDGIHANLDTEDKLANHASGKYTQGVTVTPLVPTAEETQYANANYIINRNADDTADDPKYAQINLLAEGSLLLAKSDNHLAEKIAAVADNNNHAISFASNAMIADNWYAVVLPFEVKLTDLVGKLGTYVVVNRLGDDSELNNIKFHLEMVKVPAGEPFLIKTAAAANWNTFTINAKVKANVLKVETAGATFDGVYTNDKYLWWGYDLDLNKEEGYVQGDPTTATLKYKWLAQQNTPGNSNGKNEWKKPLNNKHALTAMEAYLKMNANTDINKARILVEDFENGVTSIKTLYGSEVNSLKVAEGWYTLNGIKLQGTPTEKGIYINNGKKVVIK